MSFDETIVLIGRTIDGAGVAAIVIGGLIATGSFFRQWRRGGDLGRAYNRYRRQLSRAILLGLEILIAADIIRTVAVSPTFENVGVLAIIVLIRTFLSFTLELEITHRWPWQGNGSPD